MSEETNPYWPPRLGLDNLPLPAGPPKSLADAVRLTDYKLAVHPGAETLPTARETLALLTAAAAEQQPHAGWRWTLQEPVTEVAPANLRLLVEAARPALAF